MGVRETIGRGLRSAFGSSGTRQQRPLPERLEDLPGWATTREEYDRAISAVDRVGRTPAEEKRLQDLYAAVQDKWQAPRQKREKLEHKVRLSGAGVGLFVGRKISEKRTEAEKSGRMDEIRRRERMRRARAKMR